MLLLHISDIHFRYPECMGQLDPDRAYRTQLIRSVREQFEPRSPVTAILLTGDIAYHGYPEEYSAARAWLSDLAEASKTTLESVYTVPGNHDVDHRVIIGDLGVRNVQAAIKNARPSHRERELSGQFRDAGTSRSLLLPIQAYNEFAMEFECQIFPPEQLYWIQSLDLGDGITLKIHGLTSTLLSGAGAPQKNPDTRLSLYLSPLQTCLDPLDNVVNLVMCHHPPDWFMDHDEIDDAICGRSLIHLFGHKHRQRHLYEANYVRFSAGAVNPDRYEAGWEPGYNLIELKVRWEGEKAFLDIGAQLFAWQTNPDGVHPKQHPDGGGIFFHTMPIRSAVRHASTSIVKPAPANVERLPIAGTRDRNSSPVTEEAVSEETTRSIVFRFFQLSTSQRRKIAQTLGLIDQDDMKLPEAERYGRALNRARDRGLLGQLDNEIKKWESR